MAVIFIPEDAEYSSDEYKKEQAGKAARLIGEKYDRLVWSWTFMMVSSAAAFWITLKNII